MRRLAPLLLLLVAGCGRLPWEARATTLAPVAPLYVPDAEPPRQPYDEISMRAQSRRIPVIMYHDIIARRGPGSQWFDCTAEEFEAQMARVSEAGLTPISIGDLYAHLTGEREAPENAVVLTFDDNYLGFYENAWPVLKRYGFPAVMFVHTGYVGDQTGTHPKMTYDQLRELGEDPLFTVASHTISHPDLTKLDPTQVEKELTESKATLEKELGKPVEFFAYPSGFNDESTQAMAQAAGYKMSFTIHNGLAEESPSIQAVNRYIHTRLERAIEEREKALKAEADALVRVPLKEDAPLELKVDEWAGVKMTLLEGGAPETVTSDTREGVRDFVRRTGAQGGINGTFFALASIRETDNRLVGPCKTKEMPEVVGDEEKSRWDRLRNRPVVMWDGREVAFVPFQPETMRTDRAFRDFMPDVTDVFMGGARLVHGGLPATEEMLRTYGSKDVMDARRRAAFGVTADGRMVCAAAKESVTSARFAEALAEAGVQEAVLLDSGFSTSLVLGEKILASGHSTPTEPSRPVPHAIVLRGTVTPEATKLAAANALGEGPVRRRRRR